MHQRRGKSFLIAGFFCALAILFSFSVFFSGLIGAPLHALARPLWVSRLVVVQNVKNFFTSKAALQIRNQKLEDKIQALEARLADYRLLEDENRQFKQQLGFNGFLNTGEEGGSQFVVPLFARVLTKPPQTPYGSFIIDARSSQGIKKGDIVLTPGRVAIGEVEAVFTGTATVRLFSAPGTETPALLGAQEVPFTAFGRGEGNFVIRAPRDSSIAVGDTVALAGEPLIFLGSINAVLSEPADPFKIAIFRTPLNLSELTHVEIVLRSTGEVTGAFASSTPKEETQ